MSEMPSHRERLQGLLSGNKHMTIASVDADGHPWASPVFFAPDNETLYWVSAKNARHSKNLRANPRLSIVIFETGDRTDALYIEAEAAELNDPGDVAAGIVVMRRRPQPERWTIKDANDVTGDALWRIYRAVPKQLYLREEATECGQAVARRARVDPLSL